jgi:hypothetical protein
VKYGILHKIRLCGLPNMLLLRGHNDAGQATMMKTRNEYVLWSGNLGNRGHLEVQYGSRTTGIMKIGCEGRRWMELVQDRVQSQAFFLFGGVGLNPH